MAKVVKLDRAGRLVIPKAIRRGAGIDQESKVLVAVAGRGRIVLQKLDAKAIAEGLQREMPGKDVDAIVRRVREEMKAIVRQRYPDLPG